jgi:hypothetical protein
LGGLEAVYQFLDVKMQLELHLVKDRESDSMENDKHLHNTAKMGKRVWVRYLLIALVFEKIIQHIFVTIAFYLNWRNIGSTVAVSPRILMILGVPVAVLFMLSLWGIITQKKWATTLITALALFDMVGEFVAQGKIGIMMNVSFLVATILLILSLVYRRQENEM